jgi:ABC-type methionine transport system ATPase subunit
MKIVRVRLEYPLAQVKEPVVTHLVKDFDVAPNVLAADIDARKGGWMLIELRGDDERIGKALDWVRGKGVGVTPA